MREIIFRGKRIDNGEWVNGMPFISKNCCKMIFAMALHPDFVEDGNVYYSEGYPVDLETVGQYTGLTDKNGNRIFEGDIIKRFWLGAEIIYCVQYDGENASFIGKAMNKRGFTTFDTDGEMFEVIGNIHDNPELLEVHND